MPVVETEIKLDFKDVLLRPRRNNLKSRAEVHLLRTIQFCHSKAQFAGVPIISSNMDTTGTFEIADALSNHRLFTCIHKHYSVEDWEKFFGQNPFAFKHLAISMGITEQDFDNVCNILRRVPAIEYICIDVANGYTENFVEAVKKVRKQFSTHTIMAGNVVTAEMVEELISAGADVVKVGIGPGSVCTTRKKTGVGYPQLSAILECSDVAHKLGGHIISDGGCTCPGDIAKAFAAGADFVMLGGMFAGHDQSGGELVEREGKKFKKFYGMSSTTAMYLYYGGVADYRTTEGKTVEIPYRGDINKTVFDILGGIRSTCTYIGAKNLEEMPKNATFVRVSQQANEVFGQLEN